MAEEIEISTPHDATLVARDRMTLQEMLKNPRGYVAQLETEGVIVGHAPPPPTGFKDPDSIISLPVFHRLQFVGSTEFISVHVAAGPVRIDEWMRTALLLWGAFH
jgi:hypothetical protein